MNNNIIFEQSRRVAAFANRRAEEKRKRTLNAAKETVQPSTPSPSQQEAEIREGELLEGPGTYQGLKRTEVSDNQKQLKQKKQQMKQACFSAKRTGYSANIVSCYSKETRNCEKGKRQRRKKKNNRICHTNCRVTSSPIRHYSKKTQGDYTNLMF